MKFKIKHKNPIIAPVTIIAAMLCFGAMFIPPLKDVPLMGFLPFVAVGVAILINTFNSVLRTTAIIEGETLTVSRLLFRRKITICNITGLKLGHFTRTNKDSETNHETKRYFLSLEITYTEGEKTRTMKLTDQADFYDRGQGFLGKGARGYVPMDDNDVPLCQLYSELFDLTDYSINK